MRRPLLILLAVLLAAGTIAEGQQAGASHPAPRLAPVAPRPRANTAHPGRNGALTPPEMTIARAAWKYFENNTQPTCLANAVDNYPSTTMWDVAAYVSAMVAAREFKLIDAAEFNRRASCFVETLGSLQLFDGRLPNKVYHTQTRQPVNYNNQPGEIGFSAIDLGRLLVWLHVLKTSAPQLADPIDRAVLRWSLCPVLDACGTMYGAARGDDRVTRFLQEGRLGYEEYSAKGFQLWGFTTTQASRVAPYGIVRLFGIDVPYDERDPKRFGAHNYVVSEHAVLDGIEFNWDRGDDRRSGDWEWTDAAAADVAQRIYLAQEARTASTGILTARTEHQLEEAPYFVYDTLFSDGDAWTTITDTGMKVPRYSAISAKAALGLWVLWQSPYTDRLFAEVEKLVDPQRGVLEGSYEDARGPIRAYTANTNGIILATLLYKTNGKLVKPAATDGLWERSRGERRDRCLIRTTQRQPCGPLPSVTVPR